MLIALDRLDPATPWPVDPAAATARVSEALADAALAPEAVAAAIVVGSARGSIPAALRQRLRAGVPMIVIDDDPRALATLAGPHTVA
ncbi:MAG: hypothetical protein K1X88_25975, partial [Nannocystaceae bacterium]|nr:hypothetical protein [Nannocystaceae bacterium]